VREHGHGRRRCCGVGRGGGIGRGALVEPAALVALLSSSGHGYDLRRAIEELTDGEIIVDAGGLYRVLRRMEEEGLVTSEWIEGASGPQRREYRLTKDGRELAAHWVEHLRERERLAGFLSDALEKALGNAMGEDQEVRTEV